MRICDLEIMNQFRGGHDARMPDTVGYTQADQMMNKHR